MCVAVSSEVFFVLVTYYWVFLLMHTFLNVVSVLSIAPSVLSLRVVNFLLSSLVDGRYSRVFRQADQFSKAL